MFALTVGDQPDRSLAVPPVQFLNESWVIWIRCQCGRTWRDCLDGRYLDEFLRIINECIMEFHELRPVIIDER